MNDQILATISSAAFAIALVSILRAIWPSINGKVVWVVYAVPAIAASILARHLPAIPPIVWEILGPFATLVIGIGSVQTIQDVAKKVGTGGGQ